MKKFITKHSILYFFVLSTFSIFLFPNNVYAVMTLKLTKAEEFLMYFVGVLEVIIFLTVIVLLIKIINRFFNKGKKIDKKFAWKKIKKTSLFLLFTVAIYIVIFNYGIQTMKYVFGENHKMFESEYPVIKNSLNENGIPIEY